MLKRKIFPVLSAFLVIAGCSYFNPEDLNMLIDQSRGSISFASIQISPTAITTNAPQEITLNCSVNSDFPVSTVKADLSSVGQGEVTLNPSSDKKDWSVKFIVTPGGIGSYSFKLKAVNQKEKTVESSVTLTVTTLSLTAVYVSPSGNDGNPGNQQFPFKTLGHAVTYAAANGITNIYLAGGFYVEANAAYSCAVALIGLTNMMIQGGWNSDFSARSVTAYPSVIDGNLAQPTVMVIRNTTNLIIDGLALKNGKTDPALTNFITFRGGGLYAEQAHFYFINGEISGNETVNGGGVYASETGGIISNCVISNNRAVNLYSGLAFFRSPIRVEYCTIAGNQGDGLYFINCTNFTFRNNLVSTNLSDGCVFSNAASVNPVYSNTFEYNGQYAVRLFRSDIASIISNALRFNNMGMYCISNSLTPVLNNSLESNYSGFTIAGSGFQLRNNTVVGLGGGLEIYSSSGMTVSNNDFGWNSAYYSAPVYISMCSSITLMNNTFHHGSIYGYYVDDYKSSGGIMMLYCTNVLLFGNSIVSNTYSGQNGYGAGGIGLYYSMATISNNRICWNSGKNGGGIATYASDIVIDGNSIDSNISYWNGSSSLGGGGICINYYYATANKVIRNNSISYNAISNWNAGYPCRGGSAIYLYAANVSIVSNIMLENATVGYSLRDAVVYIENTPTDTRIISNRIGANIQTAIGIYNDNNWIGKLDANVFATNKMYHLYWNYSRSVTNDNSWTNINITNYTGSGPLAASNTVTNL